MGYASQTRLVELGLSLIPQASANFDRSPNCLFIAVHSVSPPHTNTNTHKHTHTRTTKIMAAMMMSKEPPAQEQTKRQGVDPPSMFDAVPPPPNTAQPAGDRSPLPVKQAPRVRPPLPLKEPRTIFPIPHTEYQLESCPPAKEATREIARISVDASIVLPSPDERTRAYQYTSPKRQESVSPRSSLQLVSNISGLAVVKQSQKTVRYSTIRIYEHDLDQAPTQEHASFELNEYEVQRGERRPPKFFQKSDQERESLKKLRAEEELQSEREWRRIRQHTISIEDEASVASARSSKSEASSFANASFYEGFEDRFKIKKKKNRSALGSRVGRFFRRLSNNGGRESKSMIDI
jgi:hypothetical protein